MSLQYLVIRVGIQLAFLGAKNSRVVQGMQIAQESREGTYSLSPSLVTLLNT